MRYLGGKSKIVPHIEKVISEHCTDVSRVNIDKGNGVGVFCDLFAGTGIVGQSFKKDYKIIANDLLRFSYMTQKAKIGLNETPQFAHLKNLHNDPFHILNNCAALKDLRFNRELLFTYNTYSPQGNRMFLTEDNAAHVDYARLMVNRWYNSGTINEGEYCYLVAAIIEGVSKVSNIAGTYGAFLKHWDKNALSPLRIDPFPVIGNGQRNEVYNQDANVLISEVEGDILYLDPPYSGRQYLSNYHLLESVARYDYPEVVGKTGQPVYPEAKSDYCKKTTAEDAFAHLVDNANFTHIIVSYSTEGIIPVERIEQILSSAAVNRHAHSKGVMKLEIPYKRFKSNTATQKTNLKELLFYVKKDNPHPVNIPHGEGLVKSPLNYMGGKHKLLPSLLPLFPPTPIDFFVDMFAGGLNVGVNVNSGTLIANDLLKPLVEINEMFYETETSELITGVERRVKTYHLSKTNKDGYLKLREHYNKNPNPLDLFVLACHSFNHQIRFNRKGELNIPFGLNRSSWNETMKNNLVRFSEKMKTRNVIFSTKNFNTLDLSKLTPQSFVYADPPYLISDGSYNDGKSGVGGGWGEQQEGELLTTLDELHRQKVPFGLSNVTTHKNMRNETLIEWSEKYTTHYMDKTYSNSNYQIKDRTAKTVEVYITNFPQPS